MHAYLTLRTGLAACVLLLWFSGCVKQVQQPSALHQVAAQQMSSPMSFPELLPRNTAIGSPEEQAYMRQTYDDLVLAIGRDPQDYRRRLQLAQLFMLEARATGEHGHYYPAALEVLDAVLAESPAEDVVFGATSLKASVYLSLHRFAEARDLATYAVSLNGYNALIYGSLVDACVELGQYEEAVRMADKMVAIRPDLRSYARVSYLREIHGDEAGAIAAMQMAVDAGLPGYEETAWCRLTLGNLYEHSGQLAAARLQYEQILAERPNYPFALAALARIDQKEGKLAEAESRLQQAVAVIPEVSFYEQLADLYRRTGREAEAREKIREVLDMLADDEAKGHLMGLEYAQVWLDLLDDPAKARTYAAREYERRPDNIDVNRVMAAICLRQGEVAQARKHLDVALRTGTRNAELLCLAGLVAIGEGKRQEGMKLLAESFQRDPYQDHGQAAQAKQLLPG
ncbi:MAG: hypothetical protein OHK0039_27120 [Bacteroidia bacterium]